MWVSCVSSAVLLFFKHRQPMSSLSMLIAPIYYGMDSSMVLCVNVCSRKRRGINTGLLQLLWTVACSALTWPV